MAEHDEFTCVASLSQQRAVMACSMAPYPSDVPATILGMAPSQPCNMACDITTDPSANEIHVADVLPLSKPAACSICLWRKCVLPRAPESDNGVFDCRCHILPDLSVIDQYFEHARHCDPGPVWKSILNEQVLHGCSLVDRADTLWCRFPVTGMLPIVETGIHQTCDSEQLPVPIVGTTHTMWHMTTLKKLSSPCPDVNSQGIFRNRCLRYGARTHKRNSGVLCYSYFPGKWSHDEEDPWCILKLRVISYFTRLSGMKGATGRYCIRGPAGERCLVAVIDELWTKCNETPAFCKLV